MSQHHTFSFSNGKGLPLGGLREGNAFRTEIVLRKQRESSMQVLAQSLSTCVILTGCLISQPPFHIHISIGRKYSQLPGFDGRSQWYLYPLCQPWLAIGTQLVAVLTTRIWQEGCVVTELCRYFDYRQKNNLDGGWVGWA